MTESVDQTTKSQMGGPKGRPKSGRIWKTDRVERYSAFTIGKPLKTSWKLKMQKRAEKKSVKAFERELKEAKAKENEEKKKKIAAKRRLKEDMQKRAEVVQEVKNSRKLKRIKKKQLRAKEKKK